MEFRIPPQNIEAEQGVIASMLLDKQMISQIILTLSASDFYNEEHQKIFTTICNLHNNNKPVDMLTVSDAMGGKGLDYFTKIACEVPTPQNAKHYAGIVKGKSIRRQHIEAAQKVIDMAFEGHYDNVTDFKNDAQQIMDIDVKDCSKETSDIKKITLNVLDIIEKRFNKNDDSKKKYGLSWLDKMTGGAHDSELTIVAARPSIGKTAFANQIAINMAMKDNHVAIFNLEMSKEQLTERMISNISGVDAQRIRTGKDLDSDDWGKITRSTATMFDLGINIYDTVFKLEEIRAICRDLKNKNQLDFVVVDYMQLCETMKKTGTELEKVSHLSRQFKLMAKEMKVPVWVLSQLTRANEHDNRKPKLIDLRSSGSIEQDADNVIFLHDAEYGKYKESDTDNMGVPVEVIIAKQRNGKRDIYTEKDIRFRKSTQKFC